MVGLTESRVIRVEGEIDTYTARAHAREMAGDAGCDVGTAAELETVVAELTQNIVRHGLRGFALLRRGKSRFEILCRDEGPGFLATQGRPPSGLGIGLHSARRLMDSLTIEDLPQGGALVRAQRRLPLSPVSSHLHDMDLRLAVAMRPAMGETLVGDGYVAVAKPQRVLLGVLDGLGHGEAAHQAAEVVRRYLQEQADEPSLAAILHGAHEAARSTRGCVALLCAIAPGGAVQVAGLGNLRALDLDRGTQVPSAAGCLGVSWREPAVMELEVGRRCRLLVCSDGVTREVSRLIAQTSPRFVVEQAVMESDGRDDAIAVIMDLSV